MLQVPALLRERAFLLIWITQVIEVSAFHISNLALPLVGTVVLHASPAEMGLLIAAQALPFAIFSLPTGVWVDRFARTRLVRICLVALGLAFVSVPIAWGLGVLSLPVLYAVGFLIGSVNTLFGTAHQVLVTHTVGRARVVDAHRVMATTDSIIRLVAPGVAGLLIEAVGAPRSLIVQVLVLSLAWWVFRRVTEPPPDGGEIAAEKAPEQSLWPSIREGLRYVWRDPALRAIAVAAAGWQFLFHGFQALHVLYATRELHLSPGEIGVAHILGGAGALSAGYLLKRINARMGAGQVLPFGLAMTALAWLAFSVLPSAEPWNTPALGLCLFFFDFGCVCFFVNYISMRQIVTPNELLGRVTATMRFASVALAPVGAVAIGHLAEAVGLRATFATLGVLGACVAAGLLRNRHVRHASQQALQATA